MLLIKQRGPSSMLNYIIFPQKTPLLVSHTTSHSQLSGDFILWYRSLQNPYKMKTEYCTGLCGKHVSHPIHIFKTVYVYYTSDRPHMEHLWVSMVATKANNWFFPKGLQWAAADRCTIMYGTLSKYVHWHNVIVVTINRIWVRPLYWLSALPSRTSRASNN